MEIVGDNTVFELTNNGGSVLSGKTPMPLKLALQTITDKETRIWKKR